MQKRRRDLGLARITGVVYLLYFLTAVFSMLFLKGLVVYSDAASTANNILAHHSLFRLGISTGLIATACYVAVTALFYDLFKPVNKSLSLLAAFISLVGCAILAFASVFQLGPLVVLGGSQYLSVFKAEQLQAQASLFLELYGQGVSICFVFFGVYCLLIGYLIFKSSFLPRILGVLMAFAGLGWLTFLFPRLRRLSVTLQSGPRLPRRISADAMAARYGRGRSTMEGAGPHRMKATALSLGAVRWAFLIGKPALILHGRLIQSLA